MMSIVKKNKLVILFLYSSILCYSQGTPTILHGFDSKNDEHKASSLFSNLDVETDTLYPKESSFTLHYIESKKDLFNEIDAYGSASVNLGIIKGKGKVEFSKQTKFEENSIYLLAKAQVKSRIIDVKNLPQQSKIDNSLVSSFNNNDQFLSTYGDKFITQITYGGELFILFKLDASTEEEKRRWAGEIKVKVALFSGEVKFEDVFNEYKTQLEKNIRYIENGSESSKLTDLSIQSCLKRVTEFINDVPDHSDYIVSYETQEYSSVGPSFSSKGIFYDREFKRLKDNIIFKKFEIDRLIAKIDQAKKEGSVYYAINQDADFLGLIDRIEKELKTYNSTIIELYHKYYRSNSDPSLLSPLTRELDKIDIPIVEKQIPKKVFFLQTHGYELNTKNIIENSDRSNITRGVFNPLADITELNNVNTRLKSVKLYYNPVYVPSKIEIDTLNNIIPGYRSLQAIKLEYQLQNGSAIETDYYGYYNNELKDDYVVYTLEGEFTVSNKSVSHINIISKGNSIFALDYQNKSGQSIAKENYTETQGSISLKPNKLYDLYESNKLTEEFICQTFIPYDDNVSSVSTGYELIGFAGILKPVSSNSLKRNIQNLYPIWKRK